MKNMIRSMTGYGRGESMWYGHLITAEIRSVNNRYLDCSVKLPRVYTFAEDALRTEVQKYVARGKVEVSLTVGPSVNGKVRITVNRPVADGYYRAFQELIHVYHLTGEMSLSLFAGLPDLFILEQVSEDPKEATAGFLEALRLALVDFDHMRIQEGKRLVEDIRAHAAIAAEQVAWIEQRAPELESDYRARLAMKLREVLGDDAPIDTARIVTEAAIYADKTAVDEETVRLKSHLEQLNAMLDQGGSVGRKLDFLIQEMNREANTIGSKCSDLELSCRVVEIKSEIEKMREQVQNLE